MLPCALSTPYELAKLFAVSKERVATAEIVAPGQAREDRTNWREISPPPIMPHLNGKPTSSGLDSPNRMSRGITSGPDKA